ncbi:hypothetical protein [Marinobacter goseongensis]|uniref:hypothetical protein n=1 Tax=Marinobacter goseongensis TaxID=453838 RepID=UPI0020062CF4|nr:hypothetical protein [Marinobacter goseongensis]MCK7552781.1 hypothetical protein [Marinobacter goseongensis]
MENKLEDDFALVRTDYTKLVEGEIADQLNPTTRGRAYPDRIDLETGVHSVLDRRTVVLERRERRDIDPTEWFTALSNTETIETHKMQPYPCKIVTKPKLQKMIEKHNNAFGSLKF